MPKNPVSAETLTEYVVLGMQEKKAKEIVRIDLRELGASVADFFVICHGDSDRQVEAIADSVIEQVRIHGNEKPFSKEGMRNAEWVILDYVNVVVHVFKKEVREFYGIEDLWGDGIVTKYESL